MWLAKRRKAPCRTLGGGCTRVWYHMGFYLRVEHHIMGLLHTCINGHTGGRVESSQTLTRTTGKSRWGMRVEW